MTPAARDKRISQLYDEIAELGRGAWSDDAEVRTAMLMRELRKLQGEEADEIEARFNEHDKPKIDAAKAALATAQRLIYDCAFNEGIEACAKICDDVAEDAAKIRAEKDYTEKRLYLDGYVDALLDTARWVRKMKHELNTNG